MRQGRFDLETDCCGRGHSEVYWLICAYGLESLSNVLALGCSALVTFSYPSVLDDFKLA